VEKEAAHGARVGDMGTLATPEVRAHRGKEKDEENLWIVRTWTDWNLTRELLGTSCP
jgi:hypothetical protein